MGSSGSVRRNITPHDKYIGINQRIPITVLDRAFITFLKTGKLNRDDVLMDLSEHFTGENRRKKGYQIVSRMVMQTGSSRQCADLLSPATYLELSETDKTALLLCLIAAAYPFCYEMLRIMSAGFRVQDRLNTRFAIEKMGDLYGGNRATENAIYALIPMMLEMKIVDRVKRSIYGSVPGKPVSNPLVAEMYVYTDILLSKSKSILVDDIAVRPWYFYRNPEGLNVKRLNLLKISESRTGGGYLSIDHQR